MNIRTIFLAILLIVPYAIFAQTQIRGKVTDANGVPISSATISLLDSASRSVLQAQNVSADGAYTITVAGGYAVLQAGAVGYAMQMREFSFKSFSGEANFTLIAEKKLGDVVVSGRKPVIEEKVDRTVFNVENSVAATGGDAVDALKSTPGVTVMRNEVSIPGKGTVGVMINGRLQQVTGTDLIQLLHSIPAGNLSKIEVITNPPARYDAEGNSGLINLVMKKNIRDGLKGSATGSYQYASISSSMLNTSLIYKKDKLNLSCNLGGGVEGEKYTNRTSSYYAPERWDQTYLQYERDRNATAQLGADYQISDKHTIGLQVTEHLSYDDANGNAVSNNYDGSNHLDSVIRTSSIGHDHSNGRHTVNLNYEWRFDSSGKKLNVDADYYQQQTLRERSFSAQGFTPAGNAGPITPDELHADPAIAIRSVKADVEWPLKAFNLSYGGKYSGVENNANNVYSVYSGSIFVTDTTRTNEFRYHEQTSAAYINGQRSFKKLEVQAGLRAEHTLIDTYSPTTGLRNNTVYTKLFPSAYVQYKINDNNTTGLVFSRRINRPGYNSLNPFRFYFGPNYYIEGNPALRPAFTNGIEWSYRWKGKYSSRVFVRKTDNYSDRIMLTDAANNATILTRYNMGSCSVLGLNINGQQAITRWWDTHAGITVIHQDYLLYLYGSQTHLQDVFEWGEITNTFYFNKDKTFSAELYDYYYTPRMKDYKKWASMSIINISVRWQLMDKNLIIALHLEDLGAHAYWQQTNIINGTSEYSYDNARGGRISLTYKFGNNNLKVNNADHSNEDIQRANQR